MNRARDLVALNLAVLAAALVIFLGGRLAIDPWFLVALSVAGGGVAMMVVLNRGASR